MIQEKFAAIGQWWKHKHCHTLYIHPFFSLHSFAQRWKPAKKHKKSIVLWCTSTAIHTLNLKLFDVPATLKYITNQSLTLVMANSHCLLPWWLKAPHSKSPSNTEGRRRTIIQFEPICTWKIAIKKLIQRDIETETWRGSFELQGAERQTDACWGKEKVPHWLMKKGWKGSTKRFEVIICKVCPRGGGKNALHRWTSILLSAAFVGSAHTRTHMQTHSIHTNQK